MKIQPPISVVIPTFNAARYLPDAIRSVLAQELPVDIVVVDDGSTDDTVSVVSDFGHNVRFIPLGRNHGGPARARNVGIDQAWGHYVAILDADDIMLPGKLRQQSAFMDRHADIPLVFTNFQNFSEGQQYDDFLSDHREFHVMPKISLQDDWYRLEAKPAYETLIADNFIGTSGVMLRKKNFQDLGGFDESLHRSEDIDLWFRMARKFDFGFIDRVFHMRRLHDANISASPSALNVKLEIYRRQTQLDMSRPARRTLARMMAKVLFSLGHLKKTEGDRLQAVRYYGQSLSHTPSDVRIFVSILRALLPV